MSLWKKEFTPMLLKEVDEVFDDENYLYEVKYDGIRVLVFVSNDSVVIKSRYGMDITKLFPELSCLNKMVNGKVIFDGEIIILDDGRVSFSKLQKRFHLKNKKSSTLKNFRASLYFAVPPKFVLYSLLTVLNPVSFLLRLQSRFKTC